MTYCWHHQVEDNCNNSESTQILDLMLASLRLGLISYNDVPYLYQRLHLYDTLLDEAVEEWIPTTLEE